MSKVHRSSVYFLRATAATYDFDDKRLCIRDFQEEVLKFHIQSLEILKNIDFKNELLFENERAANWMKSSEANTFNFFPWELFKK